MEADCSSFTPSSANGCRAISANNFLNRPFADPEQKFAVDDLRISCAFPVDVAVDDLGVSCGFAVDDLGMSLGSRLSASHLAFGFRV